MGDTGRRYAQRHKGSGSGLLALDHGSQLRSIQSNDKRAGLGPAASSGLKRRSGEKWLLRRKEA